MDEMHFDTHAWGKSLRDRNPIKNYFIERAILASELKRSETAIFLWKKPKELCDRLRMIIPEKQTGSATKIFYEGIVAITHKLLEYNCIIPSQHKKISKKI